MELKTLFTEHPASVGETYGEHLVMASGFGIRMILGGMACRARLYARLYAINPSPVIELNRAVAIAMRDGPEAGLAVVGAIFARGELEDRLDMAGRDDEEERAPRVPLSEFPDVGNEPRLEILSGLDIGADRRRRHAGKADEQNEKPN